MSTLITNTIQGVQNVKYDSSTTAMTIDSTGRVSRPVLPAWRLQLASAQNISTNSAVVTWDNSSSAGCFIQGGCTLSGGVVTVPVAGVYQINTSVRKQNINGSYIEVYIRINTSASHRGYHIIGNPDDTYHSISVGNVFKLSANDTIDILVNAQGETSWLVQGSSLSSFSGVMIG